MNLLNGYRSILNCENQNSFFFFGQLFLCIILHNILSNVSFGRNGYWWEEGNAPIPLMETCYARKNDYRV